jgi:putative flippase GtrA
MKSGTAFDQFIRFSLTGVLGTVTNLVIFFLCADIFLLPEIPVSIFCFSIVVNQNYALNHKWSFRRNTVHESPSIKRWAQYIASSLCDLTVNIVVMEIVLINFSPPLKLIAQACGVAAGMLVNFAMAKMVVFKAKQ